MARPRHAAAPLPPAPTPAVRPPERLRALRTERGLSLAQFAALAGVRKATVVAIERGETRMPNVGTLQKFAALLGMTLQDLRRQTGMYGPLYEPAAVDGALDAAHHRRFSPRAEEIAELVDTLSAKEQELIATLCRYFRARQDVRVGDREREGRG